MPSHCPRTWGGNSPKPGSFRKNRDASRAGRRSADRKMPVRNTEEPRGTGGNISRIYKINMGSFSLYIIIRIMYKIAVLNSPAFSARCDAGPRRSPAQSTRFVSFPRCFTTRRLLGPGPAARLRSPLRDPPHLGELLGCSESRGCPKWKRSKKWEGAEGRGRRAFRKSGTPTHTLPRPAEHGQTHDRSRGVVCKSTSASATQGRPGLTGERGEETGGRGKNGGRRGNPTSELGEISAIFTAFPLKAPAGPSPPAAAARV